MTKPRILVFIGYYLPGFQAGGALRGLANLVDHLGDSYEFRIVTSDRDEGTHQSYPGIKVNDWNRVGKAWVYYLSPDALSWGSLRRLMHATPHDLLYLNSLFNYHFTIKPLVLRQLRLSPARPVIVAPKGELAEGALAIRTRKKMAYLRATRSLQLYGDVTWHAQGDLETGEIARVMGASAPVHLAVDIASGKGANGAAAEARPPKRPGTLRAVFISRVSPKKNLDGALRYLKELRRGEVEYDIYGPIQDQAHWQECQRLIAELPPNVRVQYKGPIPNERVVPTLQQYHLFFFPTHSESFGHAIHEALLAGCPALISDQTPWQGLEEKGVGWSLSLGDPARIRATLEWLVDADEEAHRPWSDRAHAYALRAGAVEESVESHRVMFDRALHRAPATGARF
ncbi:MAG: glycosyltransferase [Deltaproteobacteria bacterium]|nr:glycosyltransferase [Deltaproteobacteria bacterium]